MLEVSTGKASADSAKAARAAGAAAIALAFALWGVLPVYWKALLNVGPVEIIAHRVTWSLGFTALLVTYRRSWGEVFGAMRTWRGAVLLATSASLLSANWLGFIWGVQQGWIVEASLGYFMNPLANVALGVIFLGERLRPAQVAAFALVILGVAYLVVVKGAFPWLAIYLAVSFGFYGLMRKTAAVSSLPGLTAETAMLALPAVIYLGVLGWTGGGAVGHADLKTHLLLVGTGLVTATPLLLFARGARRIRLSTAGILQFITPTGMFLLGVLAYGEPLDRARLVAFILIWIALAIYAVEGVLWSRRLSR